MSEAKRFLLILRMPVGERAVLVTTFALTVMVDLTVAIGVARYGTHLDAATAIGPVTPEKVPDVLLTPDVAVLERAVRERPEVAAAVLEQMHYGQLHPGPGAHNGAADARDGSGAADTRDTRDAQDGGADRVLVAVNDPAADRWYSRDVAAIARRRTTTSC